MTIETEPQHDRLVVPWLATLMECLCTEVDGALGGPVCWCGLLPGDNVAWDYCTDCGNNCGMAWVRVVTVYPSDVFPEPVAEWRRCGNAGLVAEINIGALRCAPTMGDNGEPPSVVDQFNAVQIELADMYAIRKAVICCFGPNKQPFFLQRWVPLGPEGSCVGGMWTVLVEVSP